jgi:hypothetical protein
MTCFGVGIDRHGILRVSVLELFVLGAYLGGIIGFTSAFELLLNQLFSLFNLNIRLSCTCDLCTFTFTID